MVQVSQRGGAKFSRSNNVRCIKQPAQDSASLLIGLVRLAILIGFARDSYFWIVGSSPQFVQQAAEECKPTCTILQGLLQVFCSSQYTS